MSRGNNNKSDSKRYFDWLFHANLDYLSARLLIKDERCFFATAFHLQQCIEKALKGYLLFKTRRLYDGHNLTWLCKQAVLCDRHFEMWLKKSAAFNRYYIETRYPADTPLDIDTQTITELMEDATKMLDFIADQIRFDMASYHKKKRA